MLITPDMPSGVSSQSPNPEQIPLQHTTLYRAMIAWNSHLKLLKQTAKLALKLTAEHLALSDS
jgi:hypothetical protein